VFFLFGWGRQTENDLGPAFPKTCPSCKNHGFWRLVQIRVWFTLFFVSVIPYRSKHVVRCAECSHGFELNARQAEQATVLCQVTGSYLNKQITEEQYRLEVIKVVPDIGRT